MEEDLEKGMTPRLVKDLGLRYPTEKSRQKYRYGLYECQYCMGEFEANSYAIKRGHTKSCGCQQYKPREKSIKHNLTKHRFYSTWHKMLHRCSNPNNKDYKIYGGRGISVCKEWLDVRNFVVWCDLTRPNIEGLTLDRINVDGNYEPNNCCWADASTQALNKRIQKSNTSGFVGVDFRPSENKYVVRITVLGDRVYLGYFDSIEEAVLARDNYIIENNLPHKLSTEYKKGESQ